MSKKRDISDLRDHLFDAIEGLKSGTLDVKQAIAVAQLGGVLVQSVKVEVEAVKVMGGRGSGFASAELPEPHQERMLAPAPASMDAGGELPDIADRYGKVGDTYYGVVETQRGQRKLVAIPWRALREKIGPLEMVPVYADKEKLEGRLMAG